MNISSTIQQVREARSENAVRVGAVNNAATNGTNNNTNNNAVVAQTKEIVKPDTVVLSSKSVTLAATAARSDTASKETQTPTAVTTATQKVEETTKKVAAAEKQDTKINYRKAMKKSQRQLKSIVKGLTDAGMGRREIGKIVKSANRQANKTIGIEIKQAYNDYRSHKTDRKSFKNTLHGAAVKKLDSIVSALRDALAQKVAPEDKNTEAVKEKANTTVSNETTKTTAETRVTDADEASKANADKGAAVAKEKAEETQSHELFGASKNRITDARDSAQAKVEENTEKTKEAASETSEKAEKATPPGLEIAAENAAVEPPGLAIAAEKVDNDDDDDDDDVKVNSGLALGASNANENADNAFSVIVDILNDIDKVINGFADVAGAKGSNDEEDDSLLNFAAKLNDMFSGINRMFSSQSDDNVGNRLGVAQIDKKAIGQLFENGHGSGAIHSISDAGEGSGNLNVGRFMSSMSSGINDALDSYKEVQEKVEEQKAAKEEAREAAKEVDGVLA